MAALWFAVFGFVAAALFFLHPPIAFRAVILFLVLPTFSSALAGYALGGPILDPNKSWGASLLRSFAIIAVAYGIFAVLFTGGLPLLERGWTYRQAAGLLVMTLTLGLLMVGPVILAAGIIAGLILHKLGVSFGTKTA